MSWIVKEEVNGIIYQTDLDWASSTCGFASVVGCIPGTTDLKIGQDVILEGFACIVDNIANDAFAGNRELQSVTMTSEVFPDGSSSIGVTNIGNRAFAGCENLKSVVLPDTLNAIWNNAFYGCKRLKSITLPENLELIGNEAFAECEALTEITIPDSVKVLGRTSFSHCSSLKNAVIGESISTIPQYTFRNCHSLETVKANIGGIVYIDDCAFLGCSCLHEIRLCTYGYVHDRALKDAVGLEALVFTDKRDSAYIVNTEGGYTGTANIGAQTDMESERHTDEKDTKKHGMHKT